jgi:hypothetical protein
MKVQCLSETHAYSKNVIDSHHFVSSSGFSHWSCQCAVPRITSGTVCRVLLILISIKPLLLFYYL